MRYSQSKARSGLLVFGIFNMIVGWCNCVMRYKLHAENSARIGYLGQIERSFSGERVLSITGSSCWPGVGYFGMYCQ